MEVNIEEDLNLKISNLELKLAQKRAMNSQLIEANYNLQDKVLELEIKIKELNKELEGEKEESPDQV